MNGSPSVLLLLLAAGGGGKKKIHHPPSYTIVIPTPAATKYNHQPLPEPVQ